MRPATPDDLALAYEITEDAMRGYVEETWGNWDEEEQLQKHCANFTPETYRMLLVEDEVAGLVAVEEFPSHVWLMKILPSGEVQKSRHRVAGAPRRSKKCRQSWQARHTPGPQSRQARTGTVCKARLPGHRRKCRAPAHGKWGLTTRSSGAPTAWRTGHQALGLRPILRLLSSAPRRRCPLSSNVRPQILNTP